jgi:hypothetical protein
MTTTRSRPRASDEFQQIRCVHRVVVVVVTRFVVVVVVVVVVFVT